MNSALPPQSGRAFSRGRKLSFALALLLLLAVTFVSFLPPADKLILHSHGRFHYWGHLAVFAVAGFLAVQTTRSLRARTAAFTACILFGLILEVGEHLVFHSPMEWKDVLVDAVGVCAGTLLARIVAHRPIPPGAPHA